MQSAKVISEWVNEEKR